MNYVWCLFFILDISSFYFLFFYEFYSGFSNYLFLFKDKFLKNGLILLNK